MPRKYASPTVLFIGRAAWGQHGGIQRFNRRIATTLSELGIYSKILMIDDDDKLVERLTYAAAHGFSGSIARFLVSFVGSVFKSNVLLIGHINFLPFSIAFRLLRPRGKIVMFAHGIEVWNSPDYRLKHWYEPFLLKYCVDVVAIVSRYSQTVMATAFKLPSSHFTLFPNAVDVIPVEPNSNSLKSIITVCRLGSSEREKHVDKVIRALRIVKESLPTVCLTIVGDGPLRNEYESLASELNIQDHLHFAGSVTDADLDAAYRSASAFVLPSTKEGFGIVYLEAWLRGLPVIASIHGAGGEVVTDGVDGYTVDANDIELLAERMIRLLVDRTLAKNMADAGRRKISSSYSGQAFSERLRILCNDKA
jgi:phosphatidylinositol alpha-1,6-mannosyltransferase